MEEGVRLLELARGARRLFERQDAREKRRLLDFGVSNCAWKVGALIAELQQPFDLLVETTANIAAALEAEAPAATKYEEWLPGQDSNLRQVG
jgi:site-specific DNA recombinase